MKHVAVKLAAAFLVSLTTFSPLWADSITDFVDRVLPSQMGSLSRGDNYARSLYQTLTQNGIEAHWIQFKWGYFSPREYHADFVVFKDTDGRYWARQSTSLHSRWISGHNAQQWLDAYWGHYLGITGRPLALQLDEAQDNTKILSHPMLKANLASLMQEN